MADSTTTNLGLTQPEVGSSSDTWGGKLNTDLSIIDGIFTSASTTPISAVIKSTTKFVDATTTGKAILLSLTAVNTTTARTLAVSDFSGTIALQAMLRAHLAGLTLSAAGGTGTFGVAAGAAMDSTNVAMLILPSAFTKTTASWSVGTGNGGLDTSTVATSTWYHVHLIQRVDTGLVDVLFSLSATSPTMPSNYTLFRRIGSMKTDGSSQWIAFVQYGDKFEWMTPVADVNTANSGASAVTRTLTVPTGVVVEPIFAINLSVALGGSSELCYASPLTLTDVAASVSNAQVMCDTFGATISNTDVGVLYGVFTNTSAQIRTRQDQGGSAQTIRINTIGWVDRRNRDA